MEFSQLSPDEECRAVSVHPLVVLSISDHVTRMDYIAHQRVASGKNNAATHDASGASGYRDTHPLAPVLGILLGQRLPSTSRTAVDILASFEVVLRGATDELTSLPHPPAKRFREAGEGAAAAAASTPATDDTAWSYMQEDRQWYVEHVDWSSVSDMCEQMCRVHPEMRVVGWYTVGSEMGDVAVCAELNARVVAIVEQDRERRKRAAEEAERAARGDDKPTTANDTSNNKNNRSSGAAGGGGGAEDAAAAAAGKFESSETSEGDLLAVVVDARMADAHAKLPVHVFTVRMNEAATVAALTKVPVVAATTKAATAPAPAPAPKLHLETTPSGMTVTCDDALSPTAATQNETAKDAQKRATTFYLTRFRIESDEIEHIGVDSAMNVDLQTARVQLSDEALAKKGATAFAKTRGGAAAATLSQNDLALVRQALQTPGELVPSVTRLSQALHVLRHRVQLLVLYLETVEKTGVQSTVDDDIMMREIASICAKLPCVPPAYPHAHWNDIHAQQQARERLRSPAAGASAGPTTAGTAQSNGASNAAATTAVRLLPPAAPAEVLVNAVVEEDERTLMAALLTSQTRAALDVRPMTLEQTRLTRRLYQSTADAKTRIRDQARMQAMEDQERALGSRSGGFGGDRGSGMKSTAREMGFFSRRK